MMGKPDGLDRLMQAVIALVALFAVANGVFMLADPLVWYGTLETVQTTGPANRHFIGDIGLAYIVSGAVLLFASGGRMMFGFAKPVPVDFSRLRKPRRDMVLVAAAGPGSNILLAVISAMLIHGTVLFEADAQRWIMHNLVNSVWINLLLAVFNMLPLPPLDGGRVTFGLLPPELARKLARVERAGMIIILAALFILPWIGGKMGLDLNIFRWLIGEPTAYLMDLVFSLTGIR